MRTDDAKQTVSMEPTRKVEDKLGSNEIINDDIKINQNKTDLNKINSIKTKSKQTDFNNIKNSNSVAAHYSKHDNKNNSGVEGVKFQGLDHDNSICTDESDEEDLPPIPDGGWGWVVVASAFIVSACADGLAFSFGLLHEEFTNYFNTTQSKTALIGSMFIATPLLAGPIMSALVDRYGCRSMTMIAGIISTLGFLLASISNSVGMLCLTFGLISGLAMGILYVTAVVSVAFWFDKKRNFAVSLASCGMGFGTLIYSPMTHYFLEIFDWRNTIVLLAGTLLNMCVCGALMRDPEWLKIKQKRERKLNSTSRRSSSEGSFSNRSIGGESEFLSAEELKSLLQSGKNPEYILATLASSIAEAEELDATTKMNAEQAYKRMHSAIHLPTFIQQNEKVPGEVIEKLMANKRIYNVILENYPSLISVRSQSEIILNNDAMNEYVNEPSKMHVTVKVRNPNTGSKSQYETNVEIKDKAVGGSNTNDAEQGVLNSNAYAQCSIALKDNKIRNNETKRLNKKQTPPKEVRITEQGKVWITKQIATDYHYLKGIPLYRNTIMHRGAMMNISRYKLRAASLPNIYKNSMWSISTTSDNELKWYERVWQVCKSTFDFRMFTEFHFLIFNLASLILSIWFIVPYFFLNSFMSASNTEGGPTMISIIGIASSIGIVALGWAGDQPWINVTKTYAICLIICGFSVGMYPIFITNYWALTIISTVFGLSFASSYSYTPTILMELMPLDNFTVAYGLILLSQGIGHLIGPPIGGMLFDLTKTWDLTFYMGGVWLIVSGLCVGVIPYTYDLRICGSDPLLKEIELEKKYEKDLDDEEC